MQNTRKLVSGLILCLASSLPAVAAAQEVGESVTVRDDQPTDLYAAGGRVVLQGDVDGDAVLAGARVEVEGNIGEDLIAAGGTVTVNGDVSDDARLAGGEVTLASDVAGHAVISGGSVVLESAASVEEWAWIAAGSVKVEGVVKGELRVAAGEIELSGRVDGDVELAGREIEIEDGAVINGNLTWRSSEEPEIGDDVTITGEIIEGEPIPGFERDPLAAFLQGLFSLLSIIVAAVVFYAVFRGPIERCFEDFQTSRGRTFLVGAGVLFITPVAIVLALATGIGWRLALLLLSAYALAISCGGLMGIALAARWGLDRFRPTPDASLGATWPAIVIVALLLVLLDLIPLLGGLATTIVLLMGLGAIASGLHRALRGASENVEGT